MQVEVREGLPKVTINKHLKLGVNCLHLSGRGLLEAEMGRFWDTGCLAGQTPARWLVRLQPVRSERNQGPATWDITSQARKDLGLVWGRGSQRVLSRGTL